MNLGMNPRKFVATDAHEELLKATCHAELENALRKLFPNGCGATVKPVLQRDKINMIHIVPAEARNA